MVNFNISALKLNAGKINVIGDALSKITEYGMEIEHGNIRSTEIHVTDSIQEKLKPNEREQISGTF